MSLPPTSSSPVPEVVVVFGADDGYAVPLCVAATSVVAATTDAKVRIVVLDAGITPRNRTKIERTLVHHGAQVQWIGGLAGLVAGLPRVGRITTAAYARLLIPGLLGTEVERVLYLDCDVVAIRSVRELFEVPMSGAVSLAVIDYGAAFVSSPRAMPHWLEAGRRADEPNFNTGVLVVDVAAWRSEGIAEAALEYIRTGRQKFMADEEALNATSGRRFGILDPRWNQQGELFEDMFGLTLPFAKAVIERLHDDPWIVHYSAADKPWHRDSRHPRRDLFFTHLDTTEFRGWRPVTASVPERVLNRLAAGAQRAARILRDRRRA